MSQHLSSPPGKSGCSGLWGIQRRDRRQHQTDLDVFVSHPRRATSLSMLAARLVAEWAPPPVAAGRDGIDLLDPDVMARADGNNHTAGERIRHENDSWFTKATVYGNRACHRWMSSVSPGAVYEAFRESISA